MLTRTFIDVGAPVGQKLIASPPKKQPGPSRWTISQTRTWNGNIAYEALEPTWDPDGHHHHLPHPVKRLLPPPPPPPIHPPLSLLPKILLHHLLCRTTQPNMVPNMVPIRYHDRCPGTPLL